LIPTLRPPTRLPLFPYTTLFRSVEALQSLIVSEIPEGQAIEYKSTINISDDKAKKNLCAEVASFANASGGDIVFGIAEKGGKARSGEHTSELQSRGLLVWRVLLE